MKRTWDVVESKFMCACNSVSSESICSFASVNSSSKKLSTAATCAGGSTEVVHGEHMHVSLSKIMTTNHALLSRTMLWHALPYMGVALDEAVDIRHGLNLLSLHLASWRETVGPFAGSLHSNPVNG